MATIKAPNPKRSALSAKNIIELAMYQSEMVRRKKIGQRVKTTALHDRFKNLPLKCNQKKENDE